MKVFSLLSLDRNLVNFTRTGINRLLPSPCVVPCALPWHIAIIGVESRLFVLGLTRASIQINEVLHTFFVVSPWSMVECLVVSVMKRFLCILFSMPAEYLPL